MCNLMHLICLASAGLKLNFVFSDEDRLSKRKSIGETISLQVEVESRNSPEKEEVTAKSAYITHLTFNSPPHQNAF